MQEVLKKEEKSEELWARRDLENDRKYQVDMQMQQ
jgi:hypothetical protein